MTLPGKGGCGGLTPSELPTGSKRLSGMGKYRTWAVLRMLPLRRVPRVVKVVS